MGTNRIACEIHDYFEAACMHKLPLQLILQDGSSLSGKASDIILKNNCEMLILLAEPGNHEVDLCKIKKVKALSSNPLFSTFYVA